MEDILNLNVDDIELDMMVEYVLSLPEDQFEQIAPQILESYNSILKEPSSMLAISQAAAANGIKYEDMLATIEESNKVIDESNFSDAKKDFIKKLTYLYANAIGESQNISKRIVNIPIEICNENGKLPTYAHLSDAGMDVYSPDDYTINPGDTIIVPLGFKTALPDGYAFLIHPRSGLSYKTKMRVANSIGLVDAGYRDEYGVIIENIESPIKDIEYDFGEDGEIHITSILHGSAMHISKGERIAQIRLVEVPKANFQVVNSVAEIGDNRNGGFGSTGTN